MMATFIGIDIGSCYTKVVELDCAANPVLLNHILFPTPYHPQARPELRQIDAQSFWQAVTKHVPLERIRAAHIATNLPANAVSAITLLLPRLTKNELTLAAHTEARRKMVPASTSEHIFESSFAGTRIVAKIPRLLVLVVRSEKRFIQQILALFQAINAVPEIISSCGYDLFTMLSAEVLSKKEADSAFVDISHNSINTSILQEGRLNFFRNTSFGIQDIIQDIAKQLGLPEDAAAKAIKEKGIPEAALDLNDRVAAAEEIMRQKYEAGLKSKEPGQKEEINLLELRMLWQTHIDRLLHELRRSLAYYKEQSNGRRVEYIYFLGGGCQIKNLVNILAKHIGGQWEIVLPFKGILSPIFTNAASLALGMHLAKARHMEMINFLPRELKKKRAIAARRLILLLIKIVLISALTLFSMLTFAGNRLITAAIKKVEAELGKIKDVSDTLKELNARESKIKQVLAQIEELILKRPDFSYALNALPRALPEEILLTSVSIAPGIAGTTATGENYRIEIQAELFSDYERAISIIESFRENLEAAAYFRNINIAPLKLEKISPRLPEDPNQEAVLTQPTNRVFSLTADLGPKK